MNIVSTRIAQRYDVLSNWLSADPVLLNGELAIVSSGSYQKFKVGNGTSSFSQLPYIDTNLSIDSLIVGQQSADNLQRRAGSQSIAVGYDVSATGQRAAAFGYTANASDIGSFVFNGDNTYPAVSAYESHGAGTFNVNAPLSDIYIQEKTLEEVLQDTKDETFDAFQWIQMVRPTNENKLHLHVEIYKDSDMLESAIGISAVSADSETSASLFKAFLGAAEANSPSWVQISADGTSPVMARYPVAFDVKTAIISANLEGFQWDPSEVKWVHYWWYYKDESNRIHISDIFSMPFPATTEVGANAGEVATMEELLGLQQEVMPSYKLISQDEYDGYICYSNVYNILSGDFDQSEGHITLKDYNESRRYRIKMHYSDVSALTSNEYADGAQLSIWCGIAGVSQVSEDLTEQLVSKLSICQPENISSDIELNLQFERWEIYVDGKLAGTNNIADVPGYKLLSAELSSCVYDGNQCLCCNIENRSITTLEISSALTDIVIFLPAKKEDNTARDFILRVEISSQTAPGFTFIGLDESMIFDSEDDDWAVLEPGLNLISFTETR